MAYVSSSNISVFPISSARPSAEANSRAITESRLADIVRVGSDRSSFVYSFENNTLIFVIAGYIVTVRDCDTEFAEFIENGYPIYATVEISSNVLSDVLDNDEGKFCGVSFSNVSNVNPDEGSYELQLFASTSLTDTVMSGVIPRSSLRLIDGGTI